MRLCKLNHFLNRICVCVYIVQLPSYLCDVKEKIQNPNPKSTAKTLNPNPHVHKYSLFRYEPMFTQQFTISSATLTPCILYCYCCAAAAAVAAVFHFIIFHQLK